MGSRLKEVAIRGVQVSVLLHFAHLRPGRGGQSLITRVKKGLKELYRDLWLVPGERVVGEGLQITQRLNVGLLVRINWQRG